MLWLCCKQHDVNDMMLRAFALEASSILSFYGNFKLPKQLEADLNM